MTYQPPYPGPQYPQGPAGPPVPPKKSKAPKALLIAVIGIVAFCGIGGIIANAGDKDSEPAKHTTAAAARPVVDPPAADTPAPQAPAPPPEAPPPAPGLNAPVRDGKFEFVVTDVQTGITVLGDNPYLQRTAQGAYTVVTMTVLNTSKVPYGFSPGNQDLYDTQDRKFGNDAAAAINLQADTSLYADINPGNTVTAKVVFDLPADSQPDRIVLHDSMFSGGATVSLR